MMFELSTGDVLAFFSLALGAAGLWFTFTRWNEKKLQDVRIELRSEFSKQVELLGSKMDEIIKNYVHKDDLRNQIAVQTDLIKQVRDEQSKMTQHFNQFLMLQIQNNQTKNTGP